MVPLIVAPAALSSAAGAEDLGLGRATVCGPQQAQLGHRRPGRSGAAWPLARGHGAGLLSSIRSTPPHRVAAGVEPLLSRAAGGFAIRSICGSKMCPALRDVGRFAAPLAAAARRSTPSRTSTAQQIYPLKMQALERAVAQCSKPDARFDSTTAAEQGQALAQFAAYCVLAEQFGQNWRTVASRVSPSRQSGSAAICAPSTPTRLRFFKWLQWLLDEQLARAAAELPLMQDLPIGADPDGSRRLGLAGHAGPRRARSALRPTCSTRSDRTGGCRRSCRTSCRAAGYQPFIEIVRSAMRHAGGLRIDHVLGLFRSFWIPDGFDAEDGGYVRYPVDDLLDIMALESVRAKAFVVGEDLGTVEPGVRERLADHDILSYALVWFEKTPPRRVSAQGAGRRHDARSCRPWPACGPAAIWSSSSDCDLAPNVDGQNRCASTCRTAAAGRRVLGRRGDRRAFIGAGPGPVDGAGGNARRRAGRRSAAQHAEHDLQPACQLVAGVAAADRSVAAGGSAQPDRPNLSVR